MSEKTSDHFAILTGHPNRGFNASQVAAKALATGRHAARKGLSFARIAGAASIPRP